MAPACSVAQLDRIVLLTVMAGNKSGTSRASASPLAVRQACCSVYPHIRADSGLLPEGLTCLTMRPSTVVSSRYTVVLDSLCCSSSEGPVLVLHNGLASRPWQTRLVPTS